MLLRCCRLLHEEWWWNSRLRWNTQVLECTDNLMVGRGERIKGSSMVWRKGCGTKKLSEVESGQEDWLSRKIKVRFEKLMIVSNLLMLSVVNFSRPLSFFLT